VLEVGQSLVSLGGKLKMDCLLCRRKDSQVKGTVAGDVEPLKTDFTEAAKATDIVINPGKNSITLTAQVNC
jgi:hypothetical protein